jgi:hypothetical protein
MHRLYNVGDRTEPCGTPACISLGVDISTSTETRNFLQERKVLISLIRLIENCYSHIYVRVCSKPMWHVVSMAFSISKNTAAVDMSLLTFKVTWSVSLIHSIVLCWTRKPNWFALSRPLSSMCLWKIFRLTFSNSLLAVE